MSKQKSILVATIGTRDLAFQTSDGQWLSVGNDRKPDLDDESQQVLVQVDLGQEKGDFRSLTEYLFQHWDIYQDRLKPIIVGQLIEDQRRNLQKIYLVATNQPPTTPERFRDKDTLFAAEIIKLWITEQHKIDTEIIEQCTHGENPSDFDKMFVWWKEIWRRIAKSLSSKTKTSVLLCLKGGVGQSSEAARITALTQFEDDSFFYDFHEDEKKNKQGKPSKYSESKGTNYLWDRRQKEALVLLKNWDYQAVQVILNSYLQNSEDSEILKIKEYLEMAIKWNMSDFKGFAKMRRELAKSRSQNWWWTAYEAAYLGVIRLQQGNTTEALFHSFRAVEGLMSEWIIWRYEPHITQNDQKSPALKKSVCSDPKFSELQNFNFENQKIDLYGAKLDEIIQCAKSDIKYNPDWRIVFEKTRNWRNRIFHRLLKLEKKEVFEAWGSKDEKELETRILGCLNSFTKNTFSSWDTASLMPSIHQSLTDQIKSYQP